MTPQERLHIVEEETLRAQTRWNLATRNFTAKKIFFAMAAVFLFGYLIWSLYGGNPQDVYIPLPPAMTR
jgi:hypothetical protein